MSSSLRLISSSFWSSKSARFSRRFSCSRTSRRMASASASSSSRRRSSSSLAARSAWRPMVSASRRASARIRSAWTRADPERNRATRTRATMPPRAPTSNSRNVVTRAFSTSGQGASRPHRPLPDARSSLPHPQAGRSRTHDDNGSNEHSPAAPRAARRFDRVEGSPSRINTVATSAPGSPAGPPTQGDRAAAGPWTPENGCFPSRRSIRRQARGRAIHPAGRPPGRPGMPARVAHPHRQPPGWIPQQGHRRPEDGQCPDRFGPTRRHARDPLRRLSSSGMLSAPGPRLRDGPIPQGARRTRGSKVLASFTINHE